MGTCWNCNKQVSLGKDEINCDNCGEVLFYRCNSCKEQFEIIDKKTKEKLEECKLCGYFKCPECGVCSRGCTKYLWQREILRIIKETVPIGQYPTLPATAIKIVDFFEEQKISLDRKFCPERNVPISYAKFRIKSLLAKFEGFRVKDTEDREAFLTRFDEITENLVGTELTVNATREKGSYGQEYRDAFNLGVCLGKFMIVKKKKVDSEEEYDVFVRCEKKPCKFLARENLVINYCETCKKVFPKGAEYCDVCLPYIKGKEKGQRRKLREKLNNKDTCQCYRGDFNGKT